MSNRYRSIEAKFNGSPWIWRIFSEMGERWNEKGDPQEGVWVKGDIALPPLAVASGYKMCVLWRGIEPATADTKTVLFRLSYRGHIGVRCGICTRDLWSHNPML